MQPITHGGLDNTVQHEQRSDNSFQFISSVFKCGLCFQLLIILMVEWSFPYPQRAGTQVNQCFPSGCTLFNEVCLPFVCNG